METLAATALQSSSCTGPRGAAASSRPPSCCRRGVLSPGAPAAAGPQGAPAAIHVSPPQGRNSGVPRGHCRQPQTPGPPSRRSTAFTDDEAENGSQQSDDDEPKAKRWYVLTLIPFKIIMRTCAHPYHYCTCTHVPFKIVHVHTHVTICLPADFRTWH
jgi:hypothetical protein